MDIWHSSPVLLILPKNISQSVNLSPPTLALMAIQTDITSLAYEQVRKCWHEATDEPFIFFRQMPINMTSPYIPIPDCAQMLDTCFIPHTFRIAHDEAQCKAFFSNPSFPSQRWIFKPVSGTGGQGVRQIHDFQEDLIIPYGDCDPIDRGHSQKLDVLVQQQLTPLTISNRAFHIRIYLLYKYGSRPDNQTGYVQYPPQAWHIRMGNVHLCSETYDLVNDPKLGNWAMKCNRKAYDSNPRIKSEGGYSVKEYYSVSTKHRPTYPYPQYLKFHLSPKEYEIVMKNMKQTMMKIAHVVRQYSEELSQYSEPKEASWFLSGVDFLIDEHLKPYIMDFNPCPGPPPQGDSLGDRTRNPFIPAWRVILTEYLSTMVGKRDEFDENDCENEFMERLI